VVFALSLLLSCALGVVGQGAAGGAGDKSGLRPDGQPRTAVPTRAVGGAAVLTHTLPGVDAVIEQAIDEKQIPGAVLIVGHDGQVIYRKAYGLRALEPRHEPMTLDTVFDLASLTKVIATTTAVMQLVERGEVRLNDPVAKYLPEFAQNSKDDITVRQLLTHYSGLEPDLDLKTSWEGKETAYRMAFAETPQQAPGSGFVYSDINFIVLGALVERVSGETLDAYTERHIFLPLKMMRTRFVPPTAGRAGWIEKIAPTQYDENEHNHAAGDLDQKSSLDIAHLINAEDATVALAVTRALPQIARAIDQVAAGLRQGGRLIYVGAGTSGRIAALDAVECPPTFNTNPRSVQFIIAGGAKALASASEISEDDAQAGREEMSRRKPTKHDVVLGIASSGRTPFTVAAIERARQRGAHTIALTCNPNSPLERAAHFAIVTQVGPEVLAGSSRMKAGTAHKMVLNMISTAAMTRLGYVYGNLMVNVAPKNEKLLQRAIGILEQATGASHESATKALKASGNRTPVAVVMLAAGVSPAEATSALKKSKGHVRQAIASAK